MEREEKLEALVAELNKLDKEKLAIITGISAVLKFNTFEKTAKKIFETCKDIIGAYSGYVALLSSDGHENEVLFLDSGGLSCNVDPQLPMPIRELRSDAYHQKRVVYDNNFNQSKWMEFIPQGHVILKNVLFSPLLVDGKAVGLIGLANKPGGFNDNDAELALIFGNLAAAALRNSRMYEKLNESQQRFKSLIQAATSIIIGVDSSCRIFEINKFGQDLLKIKQSRCYW
ncbi:MAG: GAF domain-containing protein [Actinomycetota bacterium]|nr:GAF domain-containing protein [Actinomycetota bacterium]